MLKRSEMTAKIIFQPTYVFHGNNTSIEYSSPHKSFYMETSLWLQPQLNEIVFEHRNKAYGAFVLRSGYNRIMSRSILFAIGFFVMAFLGGWYYLGISNQSLADKIIEIEKVVMLDPVYKIEQPKVKPIPRASVPAVQSHHAITPPRVVIDEQEIETVTSPVETEFQSSVTGTTDDPTTAGDPIDGAINGGSSGSDNLVDEDIAAPVPIYLVDQKPEFPGGNEAMYKYLKSHLSFPDMAREINVSGTVVMQFMISATGEIEQVSIIRTPSALFNRTSIETIQGMPKWKPGIYHGKPVPVVFTLPLKFELL